MPPRWAQEAENHKKVEARLQKLASTMHDDGEEEDDEAEKRAAADRMVRGKPSHTQD